MHCKDGYENAKYFKYRSFLRSIKPCFKNCLIELIDMMVDLKNTKQLSGNQYDFLDMTLYLRIPFNFMMKDYVYVNFYITQGDRINNDILYFFVSTPSFFPCKMDSFSVALLDKFYEDGLSIEDVPSCLQKQKELITEDVITKNLPSVFKCFFKKYSLDEISKYLVIFLKEVLIRIIRIRQRMIDFLRIDFYNFGESTTPFYSL
jgi:hypothetical protein